LTLLTLNDHDFLARDLPRLQSLVTTIQARAARGQAFDKSEQELLALADRSRAAVGERAARLPQPEFDDALPIAEHRDSIAQRLAHHPVIILAGETGSGKTTQLPKIALTLGLSRRGLIGCTQPRRLAARSLAKRLAEELPTVAKGFVAHKIRFSDNTEAHTHIKVMTDGVLLAEAHDDPELRAYDTLIIDEAHERSLNIDFLLGIVKRLLPKRPDLKVIVTSATIDTQRFSEFFGGAPVIEVSGRTYPVEVRYRPEYVEGEDGDWDAGIVAAAQELVREGPGDILVFLPGEREIRDAADALRKARVAADILPLYSRLANEDQDRVFHPGGGRRIVLATNVAETSLTVPRIRFVIDTGIARLNRYDPRNKIERLQIEPIAQASARQRSGRCGRVAAGIAIRLYSEADLLGRPAYTTPEILRTSLAAVILRMRSAELGEPADFPFIERPAPKLIDDGYKELFELNAIDSERRLTASGRELARIPVEPHVGRMLQVARDQQALAEVLIVASVLEMQDPRDRPQDLRDTADQRHEYFRDKESDFRTYINIWKWFVAAWDQRASQREFIDRCREKFLNHVRLREWRDLHRQLTDIVTELGYPIASAPATYENIHRSLLAGMLGNIGLKATDGDHYQGTRGVQFHVGQGSSLKKLRPRWVVAGELQETQRVYARSVARIEPEWVESLAQHVLTRSYFEPHWDRTRGETMAFEQIALYGLVINPRRKVRYSPIDPAMARELFIRRALVEGEFDTRARFFSFNKGLIREVEGLEHKARRQDVLIDDEAIYRWYDERIPVAIADQKSFERWYAEQSQGVTDLLFLTRDFLMRHAAEQITPDLFPEHYVQGTLKLPLKYRFEPGHPLDGVTLSLPLPYLNTLDEAQIEWLVPGLIREKVTWLLRNLPKSLRTRFMPVADYVTLFLGDYRSGDQSLTQAVADFCRQLVGETVGTDIWKLTELPAHLAMNLRIIDDAGTELAMSRSLSSLRAQLGEAAQLTFAKAADASTGIEQEGLTRWSFGDLPEALAFKRGAQKLTGYPALVDATQSVSIRLFDDATVARQHHRRGVVRLLALELGPNVKQVARTLETVSAVQQASLQLAQVVKPAQLRDDLLALILDRAGIADDEAPRTAKTFADQRTRMKARLPAVESAVITRASEIAAAFTELNSAMVRNGKPYPRLVSELKEQQERLVYPGFLHATPWPRLEHVPRYLRALMYRLGKIREWGDRDQRHGAAIAQLWQRYEERVQRNRKEARQEPALEEIRWLIEELRVSLFAQELKTPFPVSVKRIEKVWADTLRG
jgi:ATP-dependent helicase HrpA